MCRSYGNVFVCLQILRNCSCPVKIAKNNLLEADNIWSARTVSTFIMETLNDQRPFDRKTWRFGVQYAENRGCISEWVSALHSSWFSFQVWKEYTSRNYHSPQDRVATHFHTYKFKHFSLSFQGKPFIFQGHKFNLKTLWKHLCILLDTPEVILAGKELDPGPSLLLQISKWQMYYSNILNYWFEFKHFWRVLIQKNELQALSRPWRWQI